jgi:hypothetical protein
MNLSDQELTLYALREAQLIVADPDATEHRDLIEVIYELRTLLHRSDIMEAIERLENSIGLRLA